MLTYFEILTTRYVPTAQLPAAADGMCQTAAQANIVHIIHFCVALYLVIA